jgi:hypothetical protein
LSACPNPLFTMDTCSDFFSGQFFHVIMRKSGVTAEIKISRTCLNLGS